MTAGVRFGRRADPGFGRTAVEHLGQGHALWHRRLGDEHRAVAQRVAAPDLHRVHSQGLGQAVHLTFGGKGRLRPAEAPKGAAGHGVGVDGVGIDVGVGDLVGAALTDVQVAQHLV